MLQANFYNIFAKYGHGFKEISLKRYIITLSAMLVRIPHLIKTCENLMVSMYIFARMKIVLLAYVKSGFG